MHAADSALMQTLQWINRVLLVAVCTVNKIKDKEMPSRPLLLRRMVGATADVHYDHHQLTLLHFVNDSSSQNHQMLILFVWTLSVVQTQHEGNLRNGHEEIVDKKES